MNDNEYVGVGIAGLGLYTILFTVMLSNFLPEIVCAILIVVGIIIFIVGMWGKMTRRTFVLLAATMIGVCGRPCGRPPFFRMKVSYG